MGSTSHALTSGEAKAEKITLAICAQKQCTRQNEPAVRFILRLRDSFSYNAYRNSALLFLFS